MKANQWWHPISPISLADKGHKTVLVDLDLRNPSVLRILEEDELSGNIGGYLKGGIRTGRGHQSVSGLSA